MASFGCQTISQEWMVQLKWNKTKGVRIDMILDTQEDFDLWPQTWPWPWILMKTNFERAVRNGWFDLHGTKGIWINTMLDSLYDSLYDYMTFDPTHDLDHGFSRSNLEKFQIWMGSNSLTQKLFIAAYIFHQAGSFLDFIVVSLM